jgi:hypothetical protein
MMLSGLGLVLITIMFIISTALLFSRTATSATSSVNFIWVSQFGICDNFCSSSYCRFISVICKDITRTYRSTVKSVRFAFSRLAIAYSFPERVSISVGGRRSMVRSSQELDELISYLILHEHDLRRVTELHVAFEKNLETQIFDIASLVNCFPDSLKVLKIDGSSTNSKMFKSPILEAVERFKSLESLDLFVPVEAISNGPSVTKLSETLTKLKKLTIPMVFDLLSDAETKANSLKNFSKLEDLTLIAPSGSFNKWDADFKLAVSAMFKDWIENGSEFPSILQRCLDEMSVFAVFFPFLLF